eukprot:gene4790-34548_t
MSELRNGLMSGLLNRELGMQRGSSVRDVRQSFKLESAGAPNSVQVELGGQTSLPFALAYKDDGSLLATACEEGFITIFDTNKPPPSTLEGDHSGRRPAAHWQAHSNTILHLAWAKAGTRLLTASGDLGVGIWDVETASCLGSCLGHNSAVKSVCTLGPLGDVFASGSRDGSIKIWDSRVGGQFNWKLQRTVLSPVFTIDAAHQLEPSHATSARRTSKTPHSRSPQRHHHLLRPQQPAAGQLQRCEHLR